MVPGAEAALAHWMADHMLLWSSIWSPCPMNWFKAQMRGRTEKHCFPLTSPSWPLGLLNIVDKRDLNETQSGIILYQPNYGREEIKGWEKSKSLIYRNNSEMVILRANYIENSQRKRVPRSHMRTSRRVTFYSYLLSCCPSKRLLPI